MAAKNKRLGRLSEAKFVEWLSRLYGLIIRDNIGDNHRDAQIARAEEVSQILDNSGCDIWICKTHPLSRFIFQVKRKLVAGKNTATVDIQPLLSDGRKGYIMLFDLKKRTKINQMSYGEAAVMNLETLKLLLDAYIRIQEQSQAQPEPDQGHPVQ